MASVPSEKFPLEPMKMTAERMERAIEGDALQIIEGHGRVADSRSHVIIAITTGENDVIFALDPGEAIEIAQVIISAACAVGDMAEIMAAVRKLQGTVFICQVK